jgi:hypothetical protein
MKILFLCGSVEPGKDGVGDYTRRLCGELIRTGQEAEIISLCDKQADGFLNQIQMIEGAQVTVRRIPLSSSYRQRLAWTQEVLEEVAPDYFIQYVLIVRSKVSFFCHLVFKGTNGSHQSYIMFHEMWVGISQYLPLNINQFFSAYCKKK